MTKLQEAEKAKQDAKAEMKKKEYEVKIIPRINQLIKPEARPLVTHRGQGAFVEADFKKQKSVDGTPPVSPTASESPVLTPDEEGDR